MLRRSRFVIVARGAVARRVLHGGSFATRSSKLELAEGKVILMLSESFAVSISAIGHMRTRIFSPWRVRCHGVCIAACATTALAHHTGIARITGIPCPSPSAAASARTPQFG